MSGLWTRFVDLVDLVGRREDATAFALFRIAMGLGVWITIGSVVVRGLVPVLWVDQAYGGYRALGEGSWLVSALGGPTPDVIWALVGVSLLGGALLTVGLGGRPSALLTALATKALLDVNGHAGGSYDELLGNGLWLCVLGNGEATLSVGAWLSRGAFWPRVNIVAFPRWLAAYQLVLMYFTTGLQKVSAYWVPGGDASALYYILQQPNWHRSDMSWLASVFPLTQLATTATWLWEVGSPLWLLAVWWATRPDAQGLAGWANRVGLRWWFLGIGVLMHLMILVTMDVGPFTPLSLGFYVVMVHPEEWRRAVGRVLARGSVAAGA